MRTRILYRYAFPFCIFCITETHCDVDYGVFSVNLARCRNFLFVKDTLKMYKKNSFRLLFILFIVFSLVSVLRCTT